jgi:hypothetical protein
MAEQALYNALDSYNKQNGHTNNYDRNWGSLFDFIDVDDTDLLTKYSSHTQPKPKVEVSYLVRTRQIYAQ